MYLKCVRIEAEALESILQIKLLLLVAILSIKYSDSVLNSGGVHKTVTETFI